MLRSWVSYFLMLVFLVLDEIQVGRAKPGALVRGPVSLSADFWLVNANIREKAGIDKSFMWFLNLRCLCAIFGELGGRMECVGAAEKQCEREKATEMGSALSDSSVREDYAM